MFFLYPLLDALTDGRVIRKTVTTVLQVFGVLTLLGGLYLVFKMLSEIPSGMPAGPVLGMVILTLLLLAAAVCIAQIQFYRARSVKELGESQYTAIPIISIFHRMIGECLAVYFLVVGIGASLFIWISGSSFGPNLPLIPGLGGGDVFLAGLLILVVCAVLAFLCILFFYFLAESVVVIADIARHVRAILADKHPEAMAPAPVYPGTGYAPLGLNYPPPPPPSPAPACPICGGALDPGSAFCGNCGNRVG